MSAQNSEIYISKENLIGTFQQNFQIRTKSNRNFLFLIYFFYRFSDCLSTRDLSLEPIRHSQHYITQHSQRHAQQ